MPSLPGSGQEFPLALRLKRGEPLAMAGAVQLESGSLEQRRHWDGAVLHPVGEVSPQVQIPVRISPYGFCPQEKGSLLGLFSVPLSACPNHW